MSRADLYRIECPIGECHVFLTDEPGDYTTPVPQIVQDTLVIPLNTFENGRAVVAYEITKMRVEKVFAETWVGGDRVYYSFQLESFTTDGTGDQVYSAGICIKGSTRGTGYVHFVADISNLPEGTEVVIFGIDPDGDEVAIGITGAEENELITSDLDVESILKDILKELKKVNIHAAIMTDNEIRDREVI